MTTTKPYFICRTCFHWHNWHDSNTGACDVHARFRTGGTIVDGESFETYSCDRYKPM
jgi:hypothetical protein